MSRRRPKRKSAWVAWTAELSEACRLTGPFADWTAPTRARLTLGVTQQTLSARFTGPAGEVAIIKIRMRRDPHSGVRTVVGEELTMSLGRVAGVSGG